VPLDTPDAPQFPASYLIEETSPEPIGGGMVQWTRVFSRIPRRRHEGESYAWTMPGIATEAAYALTAIDQAGSFNSSGSRTRIRTIQDHGVSVGQSVQIAFRAVLGDVDRTMVVNRVVRAVLGPRTFEVDLVIEQDPYYVSVQRVDMGRDPVTRVVPSFLQFDYYLPGLPGQVKTFQDIPILQPIIPRDSAGKETDTYGLTTTPTKAQYLADVAAGRLIVPEASTIRRWRGNIFERLTRFVRAQ
jgi:hypothetical protein